MATQPKWNVVKAKAPGKFFPFGPKVDDILVRRVHRGPGGQIEQDLPRGQPVLNLIGQTKAGKSTLANLLVCGSTSSGPFTVGEDLESETSFVTTVWSDDCGAFVSDTPGIFENRSDASGAKAVAERKKRSNDHMRAITHFLNEDGGYIIWVMRSTGVTAQMRGFIRAMRMCDSAWPFHTMVVGTQALGKRLDTIKKETKAKHPGISTEQFRQKVANEHDRQALQVFNDALKDCGVRFGSFTTYEIDNVFFDSRDRVLERIKDFMAHAQELHPGDVLTWSKLLESKEREAKMKAKEIELTCNHLIEKARAQARLHQEAAEKFKLHAETLKWAVIPLVLIPVAGWGALPFLHKEMQLRKARAEEAELAALAAEEAQARLEEQKEKGLKEQLEQYNMEVKAIEDLVSETK